MSRVACLAMFTLLASCSSSGSPPGPQTFPFPSADDNWDGEAGVIGNVSGTRSPAAASRADFTLILSEPAACDQKLIVAVGSGGSVQVDARGAQIPAGATEARFAADTSDFSGRAISLQLQAGGSTCGPLRVSITESTVTFTR